MNPTTIFLDRDGVINRKLDDDYVKSWDEFDFLPNAPEALKLLTDAGFRLIVVTNQRGIARGFMTEADLQNIHEKMRQALAIAGAKISAIYYCPHDKNQCDCRKPKIGLFKKAARDFPDLMFLNSILIGDSVSDMEAAATLGIRQIFIGEHPDYQHFPSLSDAVLNLLA